MMIDLLKKIATVAGWLALAITALVGWLSLVASIAIVMGKYIVPFLEMII